VNDATGYRASDTRELEVNPLEVNLGSARVMPRLTRSN
jgi:hypothetical protein